MDSNTAGCRGTTHKYIVGEKWIRECVENFEFVLTHLPEDGSDYEGTGYWRYAMPFILSAAELIREQEGIDLFQCEFLQNTFWFKLYQTAPNLEENINFGDVHDTRSSHSIAAYYGQKSRLCYFEGGHAGKWAGICIGRASHRAIPLCHMGLL